MAQVALRRRRSGRRCRSPGRRPAAARSAVGVRSWPLSSASVIDASRIRRNSSTWRYFPCRLGFIRPCVVAESRAPGTPGRPRAAAAPCRGRGRGRPPARPPAAGCARPPRPFLVTRSWWVSVVVSTCQLPNGWSSRSSSADRAGSPTAWLEVCACVSSYAVTCRCRPALRSTYRSSTRRHRGCVPRRRPDATARTRVSSSRISVRSRVSARQQRSLIGGPRMRSRRSGAAPPGRRE